MLLLSVFRTGLEGDIADTNNLRAASRYLPDNIYDALENCEKAVWTSKLLVCDSELLSGTALIHEL